MKKIFLFSPFVFIFIFSKAQTNVSGGIYTNTTWTQANSPYIVIDTVVVFPGVTLTIEPGVVVKFDLDKQLEIRNATLNALGTGTDSITFTSNSGSPAPGNWPGIYFNGSHYSRLSYCNFLYATNGIRPDYMNDTLTINHSSFFYNEAGVGLVYFSYLFLDSCIFSYNNTGIKWATHFVNMTNSIVTHNESGILSPSGSTYTHCLIDSNTIVGIEIMSADSVIQCEIKYNGIGLRSTGTGGNATRLISRNVIESNDIGIQLENVYNNDQIYCNKVCSNLTYDLKTTMSINTNCVLNNDWCSSDSVIISSHIWDGYDDISLGLVTFIPFDTAQCYLTGCAIGISASIANATCDTCHNGSATAIVTNGFAPFTYTWYTSPLQTTQTATGLAPGTYTLCVVDGNGCSVCDSTVYIDSTNCNGFSILVSDSNTTCTACNDGSAWVTVTGGSAPYFYTWYTVPIQTTDSAVNLLPGTYAVCVTDVYGCTVCDSITVGTGNCSAHFNLYPDSMAHHYFAVNMASGVLPITYDWDWGDSTAHDTLPFPDHTYALAGFYTICLTITDSAGCTNTYCNNFYLQHNTNAMVYVNVIPNGSVGMIENTSRKTIDIYPNPTRSSFSIKNISVPSLIQILNPLGELVYSEKLTGTVEHVIDPHLSNGIYFVQLLNEKQKQTVKLVVAE